MTMRAALIVFVLGAAPGPEAAAQVKTAPVAPGWGTAVPGVLALMQSQPGLGAPLISLREGDDDLTAGLTPLQTLLGDTALQLALAQSPERRQAVLEDAAFLQHLPEELRKDPEAFQALPEGEQFAHLLSAARAAEQAQAPSAQPPRPAPSRTQAVLARVRLALRLSQGGEAPPPAPSALVDAEIKLLFDGAAVVSQRRAAPVSVTPEEADRIARAQYEHALYGLDAEQARVATLVIDMGRRGSVSAEAVRKAHEALERAERYPAPARRIDQVLPERDLGVRTALETFLAQALSSAVRRLGDRRAEPLKLLERLIADDRLWTREAAPALYQVLSMRNEWSNFSALAAVQAARAIHDLAGPDAVVRIAAAASRELPRLPAEHPLAKFYAGIPDYLASFALRKALDSGSSRVLVDMGGYRLSLRRLEFSMTGITGPSLTMTSIESLQTHATDLDPQVLSVLEAAARERGFAVFQVEGVEAQRDWDLLKRLGYAYLERSDPRLRTYFKDLGPAS